MVTLSMVLGGAVVTFLMVLGAAVVPLAVAGVAVVFLVSSSKNIFHAVLSVVKVLKDGNWRVLKFLVV